MQIHAHRLQSEYSRQLTPPTKIFLLARNSSRTPPLLYVRSFRAFRPLGVFEISFGGFELQVGRLFLLLPGSFPVIFPSLFARVPDLWKRAPRTRARSLFPERIRRALQSDRQSFARQSGPFLSEVAAP